MYNNYPNRALTKYFIFERNLGQASKLEVFLLSRPGTSPLKVGKFGTLGPKQKGTKISCSIFRVQEIIQGRVKRFCRGGLFTKFRLKEVGKSNCHSVSKRTLRESERRHSCLMAP